MKLIFVLILFFYSTRALLLKSEVSRRWNHFKISYARRFDNATDENFRRTLFQKKLQEIEEHNERYRKGLETYTLGVNQFTDYTEEELLPFTQGLRLSSRSFGVSPITLINSSSVLRTKIPDSFDWRAKGIVTPVKDQKRCGSCWAFATTAAIESHVKLYRKISVSISEQQLVDCNKANKGCKGGDKRLAYRYIAQNGGINYDRDYPYQAKDGKCRYKSSKPKVTVKGYAQVSRNEELMKRVLFTKGPLSVSVDARYISGYSGGVFYNRLCSSTKTTHAMLVVGYGREKGLDYWIVKNSWGKNWGLSGYIKMARNRNNHCAIAWNSNYPVL